MGKVKVNVKLGNALASFGGAVEVLTSVRGEAADIDESQGEALVAEGNHRVEELNDAIERTYQAAGLLDDEPEAAAPAPEPKPEPEAAAPAARGKRKILALPAPEPTKPVKGKAPKAKPSTSKRVKAA